MSRWDGFEAFVQVVDQGSFSSAARHLNVSKSCISRHVSELENRLGAQLLIRTTRTLTLTEVGRSFYTRCREVLNGLEEAEHAVSDMQEQPRGTLKMTAAGAFGETCVVPIAADFMKRHPELKIDMSFTNRNIDLVAEGYDLAIRFGILKDSSLIARRIATRQLYVVGSPDYFAQFGKPKSIEDLKQHNCMAGVLNLWRFSEKGRQGHIEFKVDGSWRSNNARALLEASRKGLGLSQMPAPYVQDDLEKGTLISVLDKFQPQDLGVWAVYPSSRHLSTKVRFFIDYLVECLEKENVSA
jgi:DNA-binding transcriptional LysR family regulator